MIGKSSEYAAMHRMGVNGEAKQQHQEDLRQAVNGYLATVSFPECLRKQTLCYGNKAGIGGERNDQTLWQGGREWVEHSSPELHKGTYDVRTIGVEKVLSRADIKQNTWSLDLNRRLTSFEDRQLTATEKMKVSCRLCRMIA